MSQNLEDFLGWLNEMSKFTPYTAEKGKPLRDLLSKMSQWLWGNSQKQALRELKQLLSSQPVLALYDPRRRTTISADASSYGLGAVLLQVQEDGSKKPIAFASRALRLKQEEDETCKAIVKYCQDGWPAMQCPAELRPGMLEKLHIGHQGIVKCLDRAHQSVRWPGLSRQIEERISSCTQCSKDRYQSPEPIPSTMPTLPWQKVGTDLFQWKDSTYLLIIDYFSRYIEIAKVHHTTSEDVILHMKSIFARHGIPEVVMSDNGPQYSSYQFSHFAKDYGFTHLTSSPHFPQSNGEAERGVKTMKELLKKSSDPYLALLTYR